MFTHRNDNKGNMIMEAANIILSNGVKQMALTTFLKAMNEKIDAHFKQSAPSLCKEGPYRILTADPGRKFIKIVSSDSKNDHRSVYAFIDFHGNIYKPATWKAPALNAVRGSVFDTDFSWGKAFHEHGVHYLR